MINMLAPAFDNFAQVMTSVSIANINVDRIQFLVQFDF